MRHSMYSYLFSFRIHVYNFFFLNGCEKHTYTQNENLTEWTLTQCLVQIEK